jgi:hypothetical protein
MSDYFGALRLHNSLLLTRSNRSAFVPSTSRCEIVAWVGVQLRTALPPIPVKSSSFGRSMAIFVLLFVKLK